MSSVFRGRLLSLALFGLMALVGVPSAMAAPAVAVNIVVIEASKTGKKMDPRLRQLKLDTKVMDFGYPSARVMDELKTRVELSASVTLEILSKSDKARNLKVTVLEANKATDTVRLLVSIPEFEFETKTQHKKGGTFMVAHKRSKTTAVFLAVTPKL